MASTPTVPAGSSPSAQLVGNAFVQQYYHILHHSPELVYRFYQQGSHLGRPEPQGSISSVTTMEAINEKILSMEYAECRAEIKTVDAQESLHGGVLVLVTGHLTGKDSVTRDFTQTFFLAPQDKGFFVLNDIFRYVGGANEDAAPPPSSRGLENGTVAPLSTEQDSQQLQEELALEKVAESVEEEEEADEAEGEERLAAEEEYVEEEEDEEEEEEEAPLEEVIDEVPSSAQVVVAESNLATVQEDTPKMSYASIVKVMKENAAPLSVPASVPIKSAPANHDRQAAPAPLISPSPDLSSSNVSESGSAPETEGDGHSIYIKSLPLDATAAQLEEEFKRFGPIKPNGIQVRSNKQQGFCFGFVEFEVASAVQSAIEASPITIGGRQAYVEEKRPAGSRASSRGRFAPGRGIGYRNDGIRGRGSYGGGRGYGRGDFTNRTDFGHRVGGRGGSSGRGSELGYQRVDHMGSSRGRGNRPGSFPDNASQRTVVPQVPDPA